MTGCGAMLSVFIREPEFQGQTKDRLATGEARASSKAPCKRRVRPLARRPPGQATRLLDWAIERAEERLRRRQEKEVARKTAVRKLRLPGKLADCTATARRL